MKRSNVTRKDLATVINEKMGFSKRSAETLINAVFNTMKKSLLAGNDVKIVNFGSLTVRKKDNRIGRNPRTGASVNVPEKFVPFFKTGKELRERLNRSFNASRERQSNGQT